MKETLQTQTLSSLTPRKVSRGFHWRLMPQELSKMQQTDTKVPLANEGGAS